MNLTLVLILNFVRKLFSTEEAEFFVEEYRRGASLNDLVRKYKIAKGSAFNYIAKAGAVRSQRRVSQLLTHDDLRLGLFLGIWAGDGCRSRDRDCYTVRTAFHSEDSRLLLLFQKLGKELFGFEPYSLKHKTWNMIETKIFSRFAYELPGNYLAIGPNKTKTISLKDPLSEYSPRFKLGFLAGLAVTDGSFSKKHNFIFSTVSDGLAKQTLELLRELGFDPRSRLFPRERVEWIPIWRIRLTVGDAKLFLQLVNDCSKEVLGLPVRGFGPQSMPLLA